MQHAATAPRRTSAGRPPPVIPPGMPVARAQAFQKQPRPQNPHQHMSMPPPATSYRRPPSQRPPTMYTHTGPSPVLSDASGSYKANMRKPSATLGWDEGYKSPKEPELVTPKEMYTPQVHARGVDAELDSLLDKLQISDSVRQKFNTVAPDVKSSLLNSNTTNPAILATLGVPVQEHKVRKRMSTPLLRKAKSSSSLGSPGGSPQVGRTYAVNGDQFTIVASPLSSPNPAYPPSPYRGQSMDMSSPRMSQGPRPVSFFGQSSSSGSVPSFGRNGGKGLGIAMGEQPETFISWMKSHKGTDLHMDVGRCKKLRMLLRHESTDWVATFIELGGYELVLDRLQDLLDIEWREEQHDDQMLYELLRCVKALSTSEVGKGALRASFPRPFPALSSLIFSEKKPGDLPSRQIIIELWLFLFDLFPSHSRSSSSRPTSVRFDAPPAVPVDITTFVRSLLLPDVPDPAKDHHEFITVAHRPRVFKAWVQELSDICRDYFWIMCHASNTLWAVDEVDDRLVEKPVAPGGATGGVEFEAMNYATTHFKLLNALCAQLAKEDRKKATHLHGELLQSGLDRILVTMRKASTTYYPAVHLELARYVALLRAASPGGNLPHLIDKLVGPPPEHVRRQHFETNWLGMEAGGNRGWELPRA